MEGVYQWEKKHEELFKLYDPHQPLIYWAAPLSPLTTVFLAKDIMNLKCFFLFFFSRNEFTIFHISGIKIPALVSGAKYELGLQLMSIFFYRSIYFQNQTDRITSDCIFLIRCWTDFHRIFHIFGTQANFDVKLSTTSFQISNQIKRWDQPVTLLVMQGNSPPPSKHLAIQSVHISWSCVWANNMAANTIIFHSLLCVLSLLV